MCKSTLAQKFPQGKHMEHLETGSCLQVEQPEKESESGGTSLGIRLHCRVFQQEPDLGCPLGWQHQPWEESESLAHPMGIKHSR